MTKLQKVIILTGAIFIVIAFLFPPYQEAELDDNGELTGWHPKWEFNRRVHDLFDVFINGWDSLEIIEYADMPDLWGFEFLGIVVLTGAAFLRSKKKPK